MPRHLTLTLLLLALLLPALLPAAAAAESRWQSLDGVRAAVERFLAGHLDEGPGEVQSVRIDRLDPRLRLRACTGGLEAELPRSQPSAGRLTVAVRCHEPAPWRVYVPVQVVRMVDVVVLDRSLPRGTPLAAGDLALARRDVAELRGAYYDVPEELVGMETTRRLAAGAVVTARHVAAPLLVRRGHAVTLEATGGGIAVSMPGRALEDGSEGDPVRVRNTRSERVVEGRVVGRDRVRVRF